jgi:NAD(P)-dependent dehydrogenase (short-subunit alcohol dehydrogenase family)
MKSFEPYPLLKDRVHALKCDVTLKSEREQLMRYIMKEWGRLDCMILNHAVISHIGRQMEITEDKFDQMINVNLKSCFFMIQESLPLLKAAKSPKILLTSSMSAVDPFYQIGVYGLTKAAVNNLVRSLSVELMDINCRVNGIAPGLVDTEMAAPFLRGNTLINEKNCAKPEHIASVIATICSEGDGAFMNGEIYTVHGGFPRL